MYGCCICISIYKYMGVCGVCVSLCVYVLMDVYTCVCTDVWIYAFLGCLEGFLEDQRSDLS